MSYNVNELDNELKMYLVPQNLSRDLQNAEEWRRHKAARPARDRMASDKLLHLVMAAANRSAAAARKTVGAVRAWVAGSADPQQECC